MSIRQMCGAAAMALALSGIVASPQEKMSKPIDLSKHVGPKVSCRRSGASWPRSSGRSYISLGPGDEAPPGHGGPDRCKMPRLDCPRGWVGSGRGEAWRWDVHCESAACWPLW
jgi:hypothetical protein